MPIHAHTTASGLIVLAEPMAGAASAAVSLRVPAGEVHQPEDRQGVAPLMGEFLCRGAGGLDARAHAEALDRLGVRRGCGSSSRDFELDAVMLGVNLDEALAPLLDTVTAPHLDDAQFGPCRDLQTQSLDALEDEPQERAMIELSARHLPAPLDRHPEGTRAGLAALTAADARAFWAAHAGPAGSVLAVAGAVDPEAFFAAAERLTAGWSAASAPAGYEVGPTPVPAQHHVQDPSEQVHIALRWDAVPANHPDAVLQKAAVAVLSGGMSGRLFTEVREKRGLCYSVYAGYGGHADRGGVYAYAGTTAPRAQETLDVLVHELRRLHAEPVGGDEFRRAMVGMKSRLVMSGESTSARASSLSFDVAVHGRPRTLAERVEEVAAVTPGRLRDFLDANAPGPEAMTIVTLGPRALDAPGEPAPAGVAAAAAPA
ncbi:M16 family metallopeptidase [Phycisphaera mikurensis]|uniref:Peptidase M16 family protein n=1 Tax=Phycisphaera mikurensis (strain NBRC 102666 / KCTC 22515 / FYK2301M01) TaxID=1142394 RepID=I0IBL8_PHYMF|nr:pitrilysin family protein [Phycisphaera mikurensis]MBB6442815.1 putative Zn-dependent peptidase [Phycisphaera mikurensis]BAM02656.1 peptidase M16 family protein [Phycisphaera mikurensis NBRC 102666]